MTPSVATADEPVTATTTKLTVSPGVSIPGDTVEFTVDVTAGDGTRPSGYFAVSIPGWGSSHGRVSDGTAVVQHVAGPNWPEIAPGTYTATARFTPDNTYAESTSNPVTFTVAPERVATHTAVSLSQNPVAPGQSTLVTATVGSTVPDQVATGVVSFSVNGQHLADVSLVGGTASTPFVPWTVGDFVITASYAGERTLAPSSSTATLTATSPAVSTVTSLTGSPSTAEAGDPVELTANVSAVLPALARSSDPIPTGTVEFLEGTTSLGTATLDDGTASLTLTSLAPGTHRITARYPGGDGFEASESEDPFTVTITARPMSIASRTTVSASPDRVEAGSEVALVADVSPLPVERPAPASARAADASAPTTGSVEFFADGTSVGTASLSDGTATLKTSSLAVGTHRITAAYRGDDVFAASESDQAATVTVVAKPSVKPTPTPTPKPTAKPGATTTPSKTPVAKLATTGADPTGSIVLGGILLAAGSVLTLIHARRRAAGAARATAQ